MSSKAKRKPALVVKATAVGIHGRTEEQKISFSFRYLTTNKRYGLEFFEKKANRGDRTLERAMHFLLFLSSMSRMECLRLAKTQRGGFEILPYSAIKFSPQGIILTDDTEIHIFRFGGDKYRILGFFEPAGNIFFIIGFDFSHNAYDFEMASLDIEPRIPRL